MDLVELVLELRRRGVTAEQVEGDGQDLEPDLAAALVEHGDALRALVAGQPGLLGRSGWLPATPAQARLVALDLRGDGATTNAVAAYRIRAEPDAFDAATVLDRLVAAFRRHDATRVVFAPSGGAVRLRFLETGHVEVQRATGTDAELTAWVRGFAAASFDLAHGPLVRIGICDLAPDDRVLALAAHHSIVDEISLRIVMTELATALADDTGALPDAPSFAAAIAARATGIADRAIDEAVARLADVAVLPPPDPGVGSVDEGDATTIELEPDEVAALAGLARAEGGTTVATIVAATALVLGAAADAPPGGPIALGLTVAGRGPDDLATFGLFAETAVVRATADGSRPFAALVRDAAGEVATARAEAVPFELLGRPLARRLGTAPRDVLAAQLNWIPGVDDVRLPGATVERLPAPPYVGVTDLVLEGRRRPDGGVRLQWSALGARRPLPVGWLADRLAAVLRRAAHGDPDAERPARALLAPGDDEREGLAGFEHGPPLDPGLPTVPERFATVARAEPGRTAFVALGHAHDVTYGELARSAADRPEPGAREVVHQLPPGPDAAAALLGILAAGAAAVVLDPSLAPPEADRRVARVRAAADLGSDDPAYVLFTSGSTGEPKGVVVGHRSLAAFVASMQATHPLAPGDRVLLHTPWSFDVGLAEVLWPLAVGATLVVPDPAVAHGPAAWAAAVDDGAVTVLLAVPTVLAAMLARGEPGRRTVRLVLSIGEPLAPSLAADVARHWPAAAVVNWYGPTETTIASTAFALPAGFTPGRRVPIGRPLPGEWAAVLDPDGERAAIGVAGELWLAGAGVANGYLDADATAAAFVREPTVPGGRRYRTGDRARWRADGLLEHLGRVDDQLKVSGVRVEPDAVEAAIAAHPSVAQVAVRTWAAPTGRLVLVAHVVPASGSTFAPAALRSWLRPRLAGAAIPTRWVEVDRLPTTTSGKLDRRAVAELPLPPAPAPRAPTTDAERRLVAAVTRVLGATATGIDDDFAALGGDSLAAIEVAERAAEEGWSLLPRQLFELGSLAEVAAAIATPEPSG